MSRIQDMFYIATNKKGYAYSCGIWRRSIRGVTLSPSAVFWSLYAEACLMHGDHEAIWHIRNKHPLMNYYWAWILYFQGKFSLCAEELTAFLERFPKHYEARFLLADCMSALRRKKESFTILKGLLFRKKAWIKLSNLVDTCNDFEEIKNIFNNAVENSIIKKDDPVVLEYIAMGAQRCGLYNIAVSIWEKMYTEGVRCAHKSASTLNVEHAREALAALQLECKKRGLSLFLISGTLLGFMRNGKFLSHDTDLDTGIFEGFSLDILKTAIYNAGCFSIMPQRSSHCIRIRHANGTPIDIFTHYKNENDYWHGGVKVSWHNSPFKLKYIEFLGVQIYIPDNPELYLEENYGKDWRIPVQHFDSALNCPNSKVENESELHIHRLKTLMSERGEL